MITRTKKCLLFFYLAMIFLFIACRKSPNATTFSGQLLISKKFPIPVSNKKVQIYQSGAASAIGLNSGSSSSETTGLTDANGYFQMIFTPGRSRFIIFGGFNNAPLTLSSAWDDTTFPRFERRNFPDSLYNPSLPIYIGKNIDTAIITVSVITALNNTDTIGLQTYTVAGFLNRNYTGISGTAGSTIALDTIYNMLLTQYDCLKGKFTNSLYAGRRWTTQNGYSTISSPSVLPDLLSAFDEQKVNMSIYFYKP